MSAVEYTRCDGEGCARKALRAVGLGGDDGRR